MLGAERAGVQLGQFQADQDRAQAALLANIRQQGFQDAAARRQQDIANRQGLAQSRVGLGSLQTGLASQVPGLEQAQIAQLGQWARYNKLKHKQRQMLAERQLEWQRLNHKKD